MDFEEEVKELIDCHQESDYLDFKEQNYHKDNKVELVKDLIAFANSHSIRNKYIIIGIKEENNVCVDILGIDKKDIRDEAEFQQIIKTYIKEDLVVEYKTINIEGSDLLIIKIPASNNSNRPFMVKTQIANLKENEIYIRKGSSTTLATKKDLEYMFKQSKSSKLIIQSYLNDNLSNKILVDKVNSKIEKYKQEKLENLKEMVNQINMLKGKSFSFGMESSFLMSDKEVKIEEKIKENIKMGLNKLEIYYDDSIFEFKNVKWKTTFSGNSSNPIINTLCGDTNEIERYWKLEDLADYILEYLAINYYCDGLTSIYSTNLVISNVGNYFDEDIELKLIIDKEIFIGKEVFIVNDGVAKYLGNMYSDLKEEFIEPPRISSIDEYYYQGINTTNISAPHIPSYIGFMSRHEQTYLEKLEEKAEDFKYELDDIFKNSMYEENGKIIIKTDFKKIMHNKSMFLEAKLLFASENIKIEYEIRTKNISNTIYGVIES